MNTTTKPAPTRPKLTLRGLKAEPAPVADSVFYFNWCYTRRRPRQRFATAQEALNEAARLRAMGLQVATFEAREITEEIS